MNDREKMKNPKADKKWLAKDRTELYIKMKLQIKTEEE